MNNQFNISKVLETVFIKEFNTTAHILENGIEIDLFGEGYMDEKSTFTYIYNNRTGWIQASEAYRKADRCGHSIGIKSDPIKPYEDLFISLKEYAKIKFGIKL